MIKTIIISVLFMFLSTSSFALVDSNATAETQALYSSLQAASGNYINFGIEYPDYSDTGCYPSAPFRCGLRYTNSSVVRTGKQPSIYAADFSIWDGSMTERLKQHYRNGGLIFIGWHFPNPIYSTYDWPRNTIETTNNVQAMMDHTGDPLSCVLSSCRVPYLALWDKFADWANNFRDDNGKLIPFVFRPYHEMDDSWFWWGTYLGLSYENSVSDLGGGVTRFNCVTSASVSTNCNSNFSAGKTITIRGNSTYNGVYTISAVSGTTVDINVAYAGASGSLGKIFITRGPEYIAMFQDLVVYLRDIKGVHNILYGYSPNPVNSLYTNLIPYATDCYPGDNYIDILGADFYDDLDVYTTDNQGFTQGLMYWYSVVGTVAQSKGKPWGIFEGIRYYPSHPNSTGWSLLLNSMKTYYNPVVRTMSFLNVWNNAYESRIGYSDQADFLSFSNDGLFKFITYTIPNPNVRKWNGSLYGKIGN